VRRASRRVAVFVSAACNNIPDTDLVYSWVTPGSLGYILHHRGHTHTLPIAIALGLLVAAIALRLFRPAHYRREVWVLAALGPVLHLGMDAWNIYGVHPFWPFSSRWFYGDRVFILEPLLWITAIPAAVAATRLRWAKGLWSGLLALIVVVPFLAPSFVPRSIAMGLALLALGVGVATWKLAPARRAPVAVALWAGVLAMFSWARARAENEVKVALFEESATTIVEDIALTPLPSNPFCFGIYLTARTEGGEQYFLRRGTVRPFAFGPTCPTTREEGTVRLEGPSTFGRVAWSGEARFSMRELSRYAGRCDVGAALRFYRTPFWVQEGDQIVFGDLRFDRSPGLDFPEMVLPPEVSECPPLVPTWTPPRERLLEAADRL
jgi:inner membrane protein